MKSFISSRKPGKRRKTINGTRKLETYLYSRSTANLSVEPTLFNIFMDILAERIKAKEPDSSGTDLILIGDDVQLRSNSKKTSKAL